ncbi:uncharacterized protein LOC109792827 [Cajanus cajan]|uniref:uncharacterized protein LOC109792827 n=1 Tax=Cajanus cajan TaxID=3821 RepID=UPI00098DCE7D|nr:uncharacterized protein LOC109792827 [Cajanus cajan]XP_020207860.1 uncharacterized protein LOC109792827 [Cajanus cajan]XP_020207863.1 uncharacterized protein LOC109792827 [Cajanus cajan]XP_020207864.1 uncharacterized protein LOC109792827 [Cajanus cajan]XP_029126072.1 uncharacterized protein LOC109792827 [Cajanus cajan]
MRITTSFLSSCCCQRLHLYFLRRLINSHFPAQGPKFQVSTTKKLDKGKGKQTSLTKIDKAPKAEKLLKYAMKSFPRSVIVASRQKDIEVIDISSSRDLSKEPNPIFDQPLFESSIPEKAMNASQKISPCIESPHLDTSINVEVTNVGTPIALNIPQSNIPLGFDTPRGSSQGDAPSFEVKPDVLLGTGETTATPDSAQPITFPPLEKNDLESFMPPPIFIPSTDLDLISFFNDDVKVDNIFEVLENWTSGTSASEKAPKSVANFQPLLESRFCKGSLILFELSKLL